MSTQSRLASALAASYEVKKEIGAGGMATVFLARDLKHDRDVAIKVLHPDLGAALGAERFLSEIKTTAKLQHPHILPLIDSGAADTLLYYVMPFVVGESLRQRMEREGQLPINEAIRIAREVAGALDYAHRSGVVHRDIKPENILLQDGQALVADFGIALAVSAAGGARMTQTGLSLGTPQYMSPEQAMGERSIDARSDIYAVGAVTYEMLTGEPPFTGPNVQAIVSKIMSQRPTPVSAVRDTVPPATEEAVMTALSKLPADRFPTAAQFATALTNSSGPFTSSVAMPRSGPGRRNMDGIAKRIGIPAIPVAIAAIALSAWALTRPQPAMPVLRYSMALDSGQQITSVSGAAGGGRRIAISSDGSMIAFTGGPRGQLFIRKRDEFSARGLPGTEGALEPTFSPDGRQLAYSTFTYELKIVSIAGGAITTLSDSVVGRAAPSWGSDNYVYASGRLGGPLIRLKPVSNGTLEPVTVLDSAANEVAHATPFALPEGGGILFTALRGIGSARSQPFVAVLKPGSKKHDILFEGGAPMYVPSGHLLYRVTNGAVMAIRYDPKTSKTSGEPIVVSESSDGSPFVPLELDFSKTGTLLFTRGSGGTRELAWVSRSGARQMVDSSWRGSITYPSLSPDGRRVALGLSDATGTNIWIKQLDRGPATKLTLEGTNSNYPSWTPDGRSVSYYSNAKNRDLSLMQKRADASDQPVEISRFENPVESVWSPDGKWLVTRTSVNSRGKGDIFAFRAGTDSAPIRIAATPATEQHPAVSPNGRWLAYSSGESGKMEVYVVPFPHTSSTKWAVSTNGGSEPAWSRDGRELYYRDGEGTMVAVAIRPGDTFATGATQPLFKAFEYVVGPGHRMYDVAPDGRFLMIWTRSSASDSRIFVVENWFQELEKKFK